MSDNINKNQYKLFLFVMKYIPCVLGIIQIICLILNYSGFDSFILTCIGGSSFISISILFMFSYIFKFCYLYRIPLYYITIIIIISFIDTWIGIPIDTIVLYRIYAIISGIAAITYIIYTYKNRNKPKIDHFKQLCENYSKCCL